MSSSTASVDLDHAVQIAPRTWWVGHHQDDDPFQCHVYLLENGDESVLFDPGSHRTFGHTLRKIEEVASFSSIKWFVCHHQDPDITDATSLIDRLVTRPDAQLVTHGRAAALLKYLDTTMPMWLVDKNEFRLPLSDRTLEFVFTPYLHFPGAFTTFDPCSGVLFSSDLFGGFVTGNRLFATDMSDFGGVADFHRHYMPHPDILRQTMLRFGELPLELIAPQHGRVLRKPLIRPHIDRLKTLDCGVYSLARQSTEIDRLIKLNRVLGETMRSIAQERQFDSVAHRLIDLISEVLPIKAIEFLVRPPGGDQAVMRLAADNRYRGDLLEAPPAYADVLGERYSRWLEAHAGRHHALVRGPEAEGSSDERLLIPLRLREEDRILGFALLSPETSDAVVEDLDDLLGRVADALSVVLEREALHRELELERDRIYKRAIRDPLTGLFTRRYCEEQIERMTHAHDRNETASFALVAVDIDHFKAVNDTYGHAVGDVVLKGVAEVIRASSRKSDMPVRFGGEEFFTYLPMNLEKDAIAWAERVRVHIEGLQFESDTGPFGVTVSAGVAFRARGEDREQLERRADRALYEAKEMGRNRVCVGR